MIQHRDNYLNSARHSHQLREIACQQSQTAFQFWLTVALWSSTVLQQSPIVCHFSWTAVELNLQGPEKIIH